MPRLADYICTRIEKHERRPVLLAIDNAHLLTRERIPNADALEILAAIIASGVAPIILSGRTNTLAVAERLLDMVGQIMEPVVLSPLPYARRQDLQGIRDFLQIVEDDLSPVLDQLGITMRLCTDDWAKRFWGGSWGYPGVKIALVRETLLTIVRSRADKRRNSKYTVAADDFAEAWRLQFARHSPLKFNPFKRADAPTLGEIEEARMALDQKTEKEQLQLPTAPKGKGVLTWR
jgi:hypothetical protein